MAVEEAFQTLQNEVRTASAKPADAPPKARAPYQRAFGLLRPYWRRLLLGSLLLVFANLVTLAMPLGLQQLIDQVFSHHDTTLLNLVVLGLLVIFIIRAALDAAQNYLISS